MGKGKKGRNGRDAGNQSGGGQQGGGGAQGGGGQQGGGGAQGGGQRREGGPCSGCAQRDERIGQLAKDLQVARTQADGAVQTAMSYKEKLTATEGRITAASAAHRVLEQQLQQAGARAEALDASIQAAKDEAGGLVQAEVASRHAAVATLERQARADAAQILEQARGQASTQLEHAAVESRTRLDAAVNEAAALRAKAQGEAATILDATHREREQALAQATKDADTERQRGRAEADAVGQQAAREAALVRGDAKRQAAQMEAEAKEALRTAQAEAEQARLDAAEEAERLLAAARGESVREAEQLRRERLAAVEEELGIRRAELEERETAVRIEAEASSARLVGAEQLEAELARREQELAVRLARCAEREQDLESDADRLDARRQALDAQHARLGAERVERLEQELAEERERLAEQRALAAERAAELAKLRAALEDAGGEGALARVEELEQLRERNARLRAEIATMQDEERVTELQAEIARLEPYRERFQALQQQRLTEERAAATAEQRVLDLRGQLQEGQRERDRLAGRLQLAEQERDDLLRVEQQARNVTRDLELLTSERDHLEVVAANYKRDLDAITGEVKGQAARYYGSLVAIDEEAAKGPPEALRETAVKPPPLKQLAVSLQHAMAAAGRFYDLHTVRAFLGSMAASRFILLKGISGTGKTSLPLFAAQAMGAPCLRVPVQSSWRDRADLLGFYNSITKELSATRFTEELYRARTPGYAQRPNFLVLDEANISRIEYYFADFLSELQDDTKDPHTIPLLDQAAGVHHPEFLKDGRELVIPPNTWFFLTANEDESTFEIADKTFDRAAVLQLDQRAPTLKFQQKPLPPVSFEGLLAAFERAATRIAMAEPKAFMGSLEEELRKDLQIGYGNRFDTQLPAFMGVYVETDGKPGPALDHFVATKVLRRLQLVRDPGLRSAVDAVKQVFLHLWPYTADDQRPEVCVRLLDGVIKRLS